MAVVMAIGENWRLADVGHLVCVLALTEDVSWVKFWMR